MFSRINQAMTAGLAKRKSDEKGFTLIELLVVVLIIGILSAIAIPVFIGQQNTAKNASAQSDLGNAKVALVSAETASPGVYTTDTADLSTYGYVTSANTASLTIVSHDASGFCIEATSTAPGPDNVFHITQGSAVTAGACS